MSYENLLVVDEGPLRVVTMNRPKALNALNRQTLDELGAVVADTARTAAVRAVIVTGAGEKAFVAGADIAEMKALTPADAEAFSRRGHDVFTALSTLEVPVIAAVNGFALGGGLELALACDFIWAADTAKLGLVEANLGLLPGFAGTVRLPRRVGHAMAAELIFSAGIVKADEALRIGLVNRVVPAAELMAEVKKLASTIAEKGPRAIALVKRVFAEDGADRFTAACAREQNAFGRVFATKDHDEGIAAFLEKRKAAFTGA